MAEQSALIERAKEGDVAAFERLIGDELPRVRRFARSICRNQAEADDLAQDALLKAYVSIRSYRFQATFSTWLFRIVRNAFIDYTRSAHGKRAARSQPIGPELELPAHEQGRPDVSLARRELSAQLWGALQALPVEYRTAIVLFDVEGFSQEEVAAVEGVAVGTIKSRLSRGRRQLRGILEGQGLVPAAGNESGTDLVQHRSSSP
ncbi:MAG: RNA polymerase sigma factor [Myxococcales bacterium]|nr:RNA polymerase sigma factor [Myxococcales bacterium]